MIITGSTILVILSILIFTITTFLHYKEKISIFGGDVKNMIPSILWLISLIILFILTITWFILNYETKLFII